MSVNFDKDFKLFKLWRRNFNPSSVSRKSLKSRDKFKYCENSFLCDKNKFIHFFTQNSKSARREILNLIFCLRRSPSLSERDACPLRWLCMYVYTRTNIIFLSYPKSKINVFRVFNWPSISERACNPSSDESIQLKSVVLLLIFLI